MNMRATFVALLVTVTLVGCSGHRDPFATRLCRHTNFSQVEDFGVAFSVTGHPRLVAAYSSTGKVLNTWDPTNHEHPMFSLWRGEADARPMAACFFDGRFRTADGRSYQRALVETDGQRYRLIVADTKSVLPTSRPPRA